MSGATKLTAYVLGGAIVIGAVFILLAKPALNRVSQLSEKDRAGQAEINRLDQQILAYKTAQSDLSKAVDKDLLAAFVIDDKKLYEPIQEMENGGKRTGSSYQLKIERDSLEPQKNTKGEVTTPAKVTKQNELEEVPYTLSVQNSSFIGVVNFMQYLEHIPHFTEVSDVLISINEDNGQIDTILKGVFLAKKNEAQH